MSRMFTNPYSLHAIIMMVFVSLGFYLDRSIVDDLGKKKINKRKNKRIALYSIIFLLVRILEHISLINSADPFLFVKESASLAYIASAGLCALAAHTYRVKDEDDADRKYAHIYFLHLLFFRLAMFFIPLVIFQMLKANGIM